MFGEMWHATAHVIKSYWDCAVTRSVKLLDRRWYILCLLNDNIGTTWLAIAVFCFLICLWMLNLWQLMLSQDCFKPIGIWQLMLPRWHLCDFMDKLTGVTVWSTWDSSCYSKTHWSVTAHAARWRRRVGLYIFCRSTIWGRGRYCIINLWQLMLSQGCINTQRSVKAHAAQVMYADVVSEVADIDV